jgi:hypothetical protein
LAIGQTKGKIDSAQVDNNPSKFKKSGLLRKNVRRQSRAIITDGNSSIMYPNKFGTRINIQKRTINYRQSVAFN